ncbi:hypothetical protein RQP54_07150 [Curvibacter sp. APW13]|uniref:hypothetical protein n=1 Tax=Curvibacter sp. APW13 TaxID=3077236 RepID=UPI0028DFC1DD|nr:hypothetical protein [Curvibacter sp. APW13]MDT8990641.1 hypothetical protein [Curvibacter sp. APW13]
MTDKRFAPHGQFDVLWCGDILCSRLVGTFNVQAMQAYVTELKALGAQRPTRWGRLADMRAWDGMTPEAGELFKEFAEWIKTTGCKVSVQLLPTTFQKHIAALVAQRLNTNHLYQVTTADEVMAVYADYGLEATGLQELLQQLELPQRSSP